MLPFSALTVNEHFGHDMLLCAVVKSGMRQKRIIVNVNMAVETSGVCICMRDRMSGEFKLMQ